MRKHGVTAFARDTSHESHIADKAQPYPSTHDRLRVKAIEWAVSGYTVTGGVRIGGSKSWFMWSALGGFLNRE